MRIVIATFVFILGIISVTAHRKQKARKAEAARVAAVKDSIRVADSVAMAQAAQEERIAAERQARADQFAAASANMREQRAIYNDTVTRKTRNVQRATWTPGATNRPPLD
jgi:hypothetical protein